MLLLLWYQIHCCKTIDRNLKEEYCCSKLKKLLQKLKTILHQTDKNCSLTAYKNSLPKKHYSYNIVLEIVRIESVSPDEKKRYFLN